MARIEHSTNADHINELDQVEREFNQELLTPQPLGLFDTEQLSTLVSITRRPPHLQIPEGIQNQYSELHESIVEQVEPLLKSDTGDIAYAIAELVVRHEGGVMSSGDTAAQLGLETLSEVARMYEHLFLVQVGAGGI